MEESRRLEALLKAAKGVHGLYLSRLAQLPIFELQRLRAMEAEGKNKSPMQKDIVKVRATLYLLYIKG